MSKIPNHIGLILDGNRRWAELQGLKALKGHQKGSEVFRDVALEAFQNGVKYISAYIFSTENWKRTEEEVGYLMKLVIKAVDNYLITFHAANIKILVIGSTHNLSPTVLRALTHTQEITANNNGGVLALCFNYGGRDEIVEASNRALKSGADNITETEFEQYLYSKDLPDLDLLIRTGGEKRISGYLLWKAAYSELYFSEKLWPDFNYEDLDLALNDFKSRNRRFGK